MIWKIGGVVVALTVIVLMAFYTPILRAALIEDGVTVDTAYIISMCLSFGVGIIAGVIGMFMWMHGADWL